MAYIPPLNWNQHPNMQHFPFHPFAPTDFQANVFVPKPPFYQPSPHTRFNGHLGYNNNIRMNHTAAERRGTNVRRVAKRHSKANIAETSQHFAKKSRNDRSQVSTNEEITKEFHCEPCERDFKTEEQLEAHLTSHTKCEHDGCSFVASRKMLKLHEIQFHAPGRFRIKLDTPEEIAKWREQRKRNYPTASNVAKKVQKQQEKQESGSILSDKSFKYKGKIEGSRRNSPGKWEISTPRQTVEATKTNDHNISQDNKESISNSVGKDEDPLNILLRKTADELEENSKVSFNSAPCTALTSLSTAYGSDSSDEEGEIKDNIDKEIIDRSAVSLPSDNCNKNILGLNTKDQIIPKSTTTNQKQKMKSQKKNKQPFNIEKRKQPTLLEMLLAADIRQERNIILQCIRYIKRNNFFDVAADKFDV